MKNKYEHSQKLPDNAESKKQQQKPDPRKNPRPGYDEKNPVNKNRTEK